MRCLIDLSNTDWKLLREQKGKLFDSFINKRNNNQEWVEGLLNFLDYIQDEAAKQLSDETVFGE